METDVLGCHLQSVGRPSVLGGGRGLQMTSGAEELGNDLLTSGCWGGPQTCLVAVAMRDRSLAEPRSSRGRSHPGTEG